ncbi:hypothetical protein [Faecalibaculum rodentium]|uniref:hypothetical protein n=1 Tax=Faecalibaculum rodentium TaxID=1702221 RepID=UPI0023EFB1AA|nr:hypothetical protein [Faecalibaculum rodentium]
MTDTFELEKRLRMKGITKHAAAEFLGLTPYGFGLKVKNRNEFKASEIAKLQSLLEISQEDVQNIFFCKGC